MTPESSLKRQIKTYLDERARIQMDVWHAPIAAGPFGKRGLPDVMVCVNGLLLAVEVKSPKGKLTPLQEWTLQKIMDAGGHTVVARSVEDVKKAVDKLSRAVTMYSSQDESRRVKT